MNEEQKNIETCLAENILAEVASVPTDAQFRSLVNESLDPLKQQALQQAGYDGYKETVMYHKPYTFTSSVKQIKSNLILLLRRLWRFPFGRGNTASSDAAPIRSLADMWQHYITRLQGNETYGIPSRLDQLTDLPSAPALLADRKIGGVPEAEDGMSLVQLLCAANSITEVIDNTTGWAMTKAFPWSIFPNIKDVEFRCESTTIYPIDVQGVEILSLPCLKVYDTKTDNGIKAKQVSLPALEMVGLTDGSGISNSFLPNLEMEELTLPKLWKVDCTKKSDYSRAGFIRNNNIKRLYLPALTWIREGRMQGTISDCAELEVLSMPKLTNLQLGYGGSNYFLENCPKLTHLEIGEGYNNNLNLTYWNPTNALDASRTDLIEEGSTATNNLQQFLQNFRAFIALRLANRTGTTALTLTLSAAVYTALTSETRTLADLGITAADLTDAEKAAGIATDTAYNSWLDTYRAAINWNFAQA